MAMVMIVCRMTAFLGVLYFGCTAPSHFGRAPPRPIEKKTRVHALVAAMPTAKAPFSIAKSSNTHPPPHRRGARPMNVPTSLPADPVAKVPVPEPTARPEVGKPDDPP